MYQRVAHVGSRVATALRFTALTLLVAAGCAPARDPVPDGSTAPGTGGAAGGNGGSAGAGQGGSTSSGGSAGRDASIGPSGGAGGAGGATSPRAGGAGGAGGTTSTPDAGPPPALVPGKTMSCESPGIAVSTQHVEAECAFGPTTGKCSGQSGGQQGTELQDSSTTVGYIEGGDVLWYADLLMDGANLLTLRYAKGVDGGDVEVRLDSATGTLLGTLTPASTGSWATWNKATLALAAATGKHTLYLVAAKSTAGIINLDWLELSSSSASSTDAAVFHMNHVGFDTLGPKHAVIEGPAGLERYFVVASDGSAVWCGALTSTAFPDWGSSKSFYSVDFTELTKPGRYRVQVGGVASPVFDIADRNLFATTFPAVLDYFKASRADDADVWTADANVPFSGSDARADVRGGWYDASGDISKYLSHLSYANFMNPQQIPLVAWSLAWIYDGSASALGAQASAVQAEALWGADYLLRVLDPAGFFYINVFDHWSGDVNQRQICSFVGDSGASTADYQSAMREGGGMSIAALARIAAWKADGAFPSTQYLAGAEKAFDHLSESGAKYCDDGKENVIDDYTALLAASELFAATKKDSYLQAARSRATSLIARLAPEGYFIADGASRPFWHASDAGLPVVALARYVDLETDSKAADSARQAIGKHLDHLLKVTQQVPNPFGYARQQCSASTTTFFIPHENETQYWWQGENARLGSLAAAALLGARATDAAGSRYLDLLRFAGRQIDWVLGSNPFDVCFLRGFGKNNPPDYCASKSQHGTLNGGIANGITGSNPDGSGIQWLVGANGGCGDDWRWAEQWLPHSAWYALALASLPH